MSKGYSQKWWKKLSGVVGSVPLCNSELNCVGGGTGRDEHAKGVTRYPHQVEPKPKLVIECMRRDITRNKELKKMAMIEILNVAKGTMIIMCILLIMEKRWNHICI